MVHRISRVADHDGSTNARYAAASSSESTASGSAASISVGLLVHELRTVVDRGVARDDRAGDGAVDVGDRLRRFHLAEGLVRLHLRAHFGQVDVHDISERVLREVGDPDANATALDPRPLVLLRVPNIFRELHASSLDPCAGRRYFPAQAASAVRTSPAYTIAAA
jgi:hypothetical protein